MPLLHVSHENLAAHDTHATHRIDKVVSPAGTFWKQQGKGIGQGTLVYKSKNVH